MAETILVIAAHPDDEVLGCGGTVAQHAKAGDKVHIALLAEGITSRDPNRLRTRRQTELGRLKSAAKAAAKKLGAGSVVLHDFPDNRMDSVDLLDIIKVVEGLVTKHRPNTVYTHHRGDLNVDHQRIHDAVLTACRPVPEQCVRRILCFEVPSSTEWRTTESGGGFVPNYFVDINNTLSIKLAALRCYADELRPWPHPRSIEAVTHLARWRGASSGAAAAEAFVVGRILA